jgi:hypothetical protein
LPEGYWRKGTLEVFVYEVQSFHEERT